MLHLYWIEVIRRSHFSLFFRPLPPKPFSPESLLRCSGCAPPGRSESEQPSGRAFLCLPHSVTRGSPFLRSVKVSGRYPHSILKHAQANSATKKKSKHLQRILFRGVCSTGIGDFERWQALMSLDFLSAALLRFTKKSVMCVLLSGVAVLLRLTHGTCL